MQELWGGQTASRHCFWGKSWGILHSRRPCGVFQFPGLAGVRSLFPSASEEPSSYTPLPLAAHPTPSNKAQVVQHLSNLPKSPRSAPQNARSVGRGEEDSKLGPARRALHGKLMTFCLSCLQTGLICMYALGIISPIFQACGCIPASSSEKFPPAVPAVTAPGAASEANQTPAGGEERSDTLSWGIPGGCRTPGYGEQPWALGESLQQQPPASSGGWIFG